MAKITYITADGTRREIEVANGFTVMEGARDNGIDGIVAECGGGCACATCHAYIVQGADRIPPAKDLESEMLEFAADLDPARSRLTCQIVVSDAIDGLVVQVPERQG